MRNLLETIEASFVFKVDWLGSEKCWQKKISPNYLRHAKFNTGFGTCHAFSWLLVHNLGVENEFHFDFMLYLCVDFPLSV